MATNYSDALTFVLGREGGWYNGEEPRDPNPTMFGVIQKTYDAYRTAKGLPIQSVRLILPNELQDIYRGYWAEAGCDHVGPLTAITLLDSSINEGSGTAVRLLQKAAGVAPDGQLGPASIAAISQADDHTLASRFCWERLRSYANIVEGVPSKYTPDLLSWLVRVLKFRETYLT